MIKITKLEAEYILEAISAMRDYCSEEVGYLLSYIEDYLDNSEEILNACLANQALEAYKLDEDEQIGELTAEEYTNLISNTKS